MLALPHTLGTSGAVSYRTSVHMEHLILREGEHQVNQYGDFNPDYISPIMCE